MDQSKTKDEKKFWHLGWGSLLLLFAAWIALGNVRGFLYALRTQTLESWFIADSVLRLCCVVFFTWVGVRAIRRFMHEVPRTRIGWGRLLLGLILIYNQIRDHFVANPDALQPDNADQAAGMQFARAVISIAAVGLVFAAFLKKRPEPKVSQERAV